MPDAAAAVAREAPRVKIDAPRVTGSISLVGARLDSLELDDYRETLAKNSPLVRLLAPRQDPQPTYVQFGWTGRGRVKVPDQSTLWTASATTLTRAQPVTLRWDNGAGVIFEITYSIDDNYMFRAEQRVRNQSSVPVTVHPWSRVRRDYTPETGGYTVLHEGLIGWVGGRLHDVTYSSAKSEGEKHEGIAFQGSGTGGWAGFTDKYWLIAAVPDQAVATTTTYRFLDEPTGAAYQVDTVTDKAEQVPPQGAVTTASRAFVGAKEVHLLEPVRGEGRHQPLLLCR